MAETETEYNVELLKAIKKVPYDHKKSGIRVLIKWEGYPEDENTWEPIENLNPVSAVRMLKDLGRELESFPKSKKLIQEAVQAWYRINDPGDEPNLARLMSPASEQEKESSKKKVKNKTLNEKNNGRRKSQQRNEKKTDKNSSRLSKASKDKSETSEALPPSNKGTPSATTPVQLAKSKTALPTNFTQAEEEDGFTISKKRVAVEYSSLIYFSSTNTFKVTRSEIDPQTKNLSGTQQIDVIDEFTNEKISQKALFSFVLQNFAEREKELESLQRRFYEQCRKSKLAQG